jgi:serine/threonine-protein kinase
MLTEPLSPNLFPVGTLLDGKFRVMRCIGRGGMGAVYEILHVLTKHRRALKMLYPHVAHDRDAVDRFLREASAAGTIGNKHITETYDAGWLTTGEPYVLMELLEGKSLHDWVNQKTRLPLDEALVIVAQAATGVHAAHKAGIVHRDLKPENLFVTLDDERRIFTKVLDFGVSKFDDGLGKTRATRDGAFMGTPQYMSPEQFVDGKTVDGRADIYSLGVILFECVTGKHPYPCDTLAQLARKIIVEQPPTPSSLRGDIPPALDQVLDRALKKEPGERFPTAEAFAQALDNVRTGGNLTLPHGSVWPSELPPPLELASLRVDPTPASSQPTKRSAGPQPHVPSTPPLDLPSTAGGTVLLSPTTTEGSTLPLRDAPTQPGLLVGVQRPGARRTSPALIGAMIGAVAFGGALAWWRSTSTSAAVTSDTASPAAAPPPSETTRAAQPPPASSGPLVAEASTSAEPSAPPPRASAPGSAPRGTASAPPQPPTSAPKPKEHARVDEFPDE